VKATTHTEVYRPFTGVLRATGMRFAPLVSMSVRVASKRKLPLLLLYLVPGIATIVFSFLVYLGFQAEDMTASRTGVIGGVAGVLARQAQQLLAVKTQVITNVSQMRMFALLATAWFGAGMFAEDRRVGAHQLYFARPLTRLDYFLGKFFATAWFGALSFIVPGLVINLTAIFTSPDWSFLKEEWEVPLQTLAYGSIWVVLVTSLVLAASSLTNKRWYALAIVLGFVFMSFAMGRVFGHVQDEPWLRLLNPYSAMTQVGDQIFGVKDRWFEYPEWLPATVVAALVLGSWSLIAVRLRRLEIVS
jgi:ABC-2 type transport system permease protein